MVIIFFLPESTINFNRWSLLLLQVQTLPPTAKCGAVHDAHTHTHTPTHTHLTAALVSFRAQRRRRAPWWATCPQPTPCQVAPCPRASSRWDSPPHTHTLSPPSLRHLHHLHLSRFHPSTWWRVKWRPGSVFHLGWFIASQRSGQLLKPIDWHSIETQKYPKFFIFFFAFYSFSVKNIFYSETFQTNFKVHKWWKVQYIYLIHFCFKEEECFAYWLPLDSNWNISQINFLNSFTVKKKKRKFFRRKKRAEIFSDWKENVHGNLLW